MIFIKCYIENFGKLHQYSIEFTEQFTVINEPNGFGKTTLAAFIKAMLYGFPKSSKSIEKNERKKYMPWQGGTYGGFLDFEQNGIQYRIERSFGVSAKEDHFQVYYLDPFSVCDEYSENIGLELLGVSADSFEKTTYLPQVRWSSEYTTKELRDTLSNIVEKSSDIGTYEKGIQALKKQRNELLSYRGKSGLLYEQNAQISEDEHRLNELRASEQKLSEIRENLTRRETQLRHMQKEQSIITEQLETNNEISSLYSAYPAGLPTDYEMKQCIHSLYQNNSPDDAPSSEELDELSEMFHDGIPSESDIVYYEEIADEINDAKITISDTIDEINDCKRSVIMHSVFSILAVILCGSLYIAQRFFEIRIMNYIPMIITILFGLSSALLIMIRCIGMTKRLKHLNVVLRQHEALLYQYEQQLSEEMLQYDIDELNPIESLETLKKSCSRYMELYRFLKSHNNSDNMIRTIFDKYRLHHLSADEDSVHLIMADKRRLRELLLRKQSNQSRLNTMLEENESCFYSLLDRDSMSLQTAMKTQIEDLQKMIIQYHKEIALLQKEIDCIPSLENKLAALLAKRKETMNRVNLLDKTINHLQSAYDSLSVSFLIPLKKQFTVHLNELMGISADRIFIDRNISISIEQFGIHRNQAHFSAAELDMMALCMRLAIVDILYPENKPILIMDDPFVNLDSKNVSSALAVLKRISRTHQILYLTCHSSRT